MSTPTRFPVAKSRDPIVIICSGHKSASFLQRRLLRKWRRQSGSVRCRRRRGIYATGADSITAWPHLDQIHQLSQPGSSVIAAHTSDGYLTAAHGRRIRDTVAAVG